MTTTGRSIVPPARFHRADDKRRPPALWIAVFSLLAIFIGLLSLAARQVQPRLASMAPVVVLSLLTCEIASVVLGCGGGGGGHTQGRQYTVTVSGTNQGLTRTVNLSLMVDCSR